jgi:hypothetical protein
MFARKPATKSRPIPLAGILRAASRESLSPGNRALAISSRDAQSNAHFAADAFRRIPPRLCLTSSSSRTTNLRFTTKFFVICTYANRACNSRRMRTYTKKGEGVGLMSDPKSTISRKGLRQGFWTWCIFGRRLGRPEGKSGTGRRDTMRRFCLALTQATGIPVLASAGLAQHEARSLRRMR